MRAADARVDDSREPAVNFERSRRSSATSSGSSRSGSVPSYSRARSSVNAAVFVAALMFCTRTAIPACVQPVDHARAAY